tara:strand:- start:537 stop:734 length:198 start_codon:yes stop_codon:yes gene_type:complete
MWGLRMIYNKKSKLFYHGNTKKKYMPHELVMDGSNLRCKHCSQLGWYCIRNDGGMKGCKKRKRVG